ncbi:MAG: MFS transporter, partial [Brevefilum sp.]|nr:MFS transporter [Brevefilum sp.]
LGDSFVSVSTIIPVFASTLTDSPVLIGLVPAVIDAGWFIPQLLMAGYVHRLQQKMPFARMMAIIERIPYLVLPLTAFLLQWVSKDLALVFFLLVVAWRGVASGLVALPWQEVIASVIPSQVRSRYFGVSHMFGRILGVLGSGISTIILANLAYPNNYALSFMIGAVFIWISFFFFSRTIEPKPTKELTVIQESRQKEIFRDFSAYKAVLQRDPNFVRYLISRAFVHLGGMAVAFLAVFGIQHYRLADEQAAIFTGMIFISGTLGYIVFGLIGDRIGPRQTVFFADMMQACVFLLAFFSPGLWSIYLLFFIFGFAQSAYVIGGLIIGMELGPDDERPIYIGLARTLPGFVILAAPIIGGLLVNWFSFQTMFMVAFLFTIVGTILILGVSDRKNIPQQNF